MIYDMESKKLEEGKDKLETLYMLSLKLRFKMKSRQLLQRL